MVRYWIGHISTTALTQPPPFLLSKASPLSATELAYLTRLAATNSLSAHLQSFCSLANLFCSFEPRPGSLRSATAPKEQDASFAAYRSQHFSSYGTSRLGGSSSFKNYSTGINTPNDSFKKYGRDATGHGEEFTSYAPDGNVANGSFANYGFGATGGSGEFKTYHPRVNIPNLLFTTYDSDGNSHRLSFSSYSNETNSGNEVFTSYGKHGNGVPSQFISYEDDSNTVDSTFTGYNLLGKTVGSDLFTVSSLLFPSSRPRQGVQRKLAVKPHDTGNGGNDSFTSYGDTGNNPHNNFKGYGSGGNAETDSFVNYRNRANVGDDSFQSYARNANAAKTTFANYGKSFNPGNDTFKEYGKGSKGQTTIGFRSYSLDRTFKGYINKGVTFAGYSNGTIGAGQRGGSDGSEKTRVVEKGRFFRESELREGNLMAMPDIRDKMPARSFLPRTIASKLPFSSSRLADIREIFHANENSATENMIANVLEECERLPSRGETKQCVGSAEDMIDFAVSALGSRGIVVRTTENVNGSSLEVMIGAVRGIDGGRVTESVSCHQSLYPYLVYYCHSVPKVRAYEADIVDVASRATVNHGVAICHLDTSAWSPGHGAFVALGHGPGQIEVCHWIFENDMTWTVADDQ